MSKTLKGIFGTQPVRLQWMAGLLVLILSLHGFAHAQPIHPNHDCPVCLLIQFSAVLIFALPSLRGLLSGSNPRPLFPDPENRPNLFISPSRSPRAPPIFPF